MPHKAQQFVLIDKVMLLAGIGIFNRRLPARLLALVLPADQVCCIACFVRHGCIIRSKRYTNATQTLLGALRAVISTGQGPIALDPPLPTSPATASHHTLR